MKLAKLVYRIAGAGAAVAFMSIGLAGGTAKAANMKVGFCIPTGPAPYVLPYFIAKDLGWYEQWGLDVREVKVSGNANCVRLLLTKSADVSALGPNVVMNTILKGANIRTIISWMPVSDYRLVVPKDSTVKSVKDIAAQGLTLGISAPGGMPEQYPKMVFEKHGLDYGKVKFVSIGGMGSRLRAVIAGKVDASLVDTFFAQFGAAKGATRILLTLADEFPGLSHLAMASTTASLADPEKRAALKIFVRGGIEGARFIEKDVAGATEVLYNRLPKVNREIILKTLKQLNQGKNWGTNGGVERKIHDVSATAYAKRGLIERQITYEETVDNSLVEEVLKDIGRM